MNEKRLLVTESTRFVRNIVWFFLLFETYMGVTVLSIRDINLLFPNLGINFPIINLSTKISLNIFMILAPVTLLCFHVVSLTYILNHVNLLKTLQKDVNYIPPSILNYAFSKGREKNYIRYISFTLVFFLFFLFPETLLFLSLWRFSAYQVFGISLLHFLLVLVCFLCDLIFIYKLLQEPAYRIIFTTILFAPVVLSLGVLAEDYAIHVFPDSLTYFEKVQTEDIALKFPWFHLTISPNDIEKVLRDRNISSDILRNRSFKFANFENISFPRTNLSFSDFSGANLRGADLSFSDLTLSRLDYAILVSSNLEGAILWQVKLDHSDLSEAKLSHAKIYCESLKDANLVKAMLDHTQFMVLKVISVTAWYANFEYANIENTTFQNAEFQKAKFRHADLSGISIRNSDFWGTDFEKSKFLQVKVRNSYFDEANFNKVWMEDVVFLNSSLKGASFKHIWANNCGFIRDKVFKSDFDYAFFLNWKVQMSDFSESSIKFAKIIDSNLESTDLFSSDLSYTTFKKTKFKDVDLRGADLKSTKFYSCKLISPKLSGVLNFKKAVFLTLIFTNLLSGNMI